MTADGVQVEPGGVVRRASPADLPALDALVREHARFERAAEPPADLAGRLTPLLFGPDARLAAFVAGSPDAVIGYATCSREISTWLGAEFLHLDCLFVRDENRGNGAGRRLVDAITGYARELGIEQVQWQTPDWNIGGAGSTSAWAESRRPSCVSLSRRGQCDCSTGAGGARRSISLRHTIRST